MSPRVFLLAVLATALTAVPAAHAKTVWLCSPLKSADPCDRSLTATVVGTDGQQRGTVHPTHASKPGVDCFYVYPTVSDERRPEADFKITANERAIAYFQASPFSQVCRLWAPMYRQVTLQGLLQPTTVTAAMRDRGFKDVAAAWHDYLRHYNHGRGVIFLSHSQGSFVLRQLIGQDVEKHAADLRRLVSAFLIGGNVTVAKGKDVGGDFKKVRACRSASQTGCVVAYSTYNATPPADSKFGRATKAGQEVLCTAPGALGGGSGALDSFQPTASFPGTLGPFVKAEEGDVPAVSTPWIEEPGAFSGRCSSEGGANVLRVTPAPGVHDLTPQPDPTWGLHLADMNLSMGTLVDLARRQARAYERRH